MGFCGRRLPAIHLAYADLSRGQQRPEHHRGRVGRRQHGLGFDPAFELFVQPLDRIRCADAAPLARWQAYEGEQAVSCFLQAVGNGAMLEPPFADEGLAAKRDLLGCRRIDHVVIVRGDLLVQALRSMREQVSVLVDCAALHRHAIPDRGDGLVEPRRAIDDEEFRISAWLVDRHRNRAELTEFVLKRSPLIE
jgi:hypothetical protein